MGMKYLVMVSALLLVVIACGSDGSSETTTPPTGIEDGVVFVESTQVSVAESFPMQIFLAVSGTLPTPCHELSSKVTVVGERVDVELKSTILLGQDCAQVLEPFDENIKLFDTEGGEYDIYVNGDLVDRLDL